MIAKHSKSNTTKPNVHQNCWYLPQILIMFVQVKKMCSFLIVYFALDTFHMCSQTFTVSSKTQWLILTSVISLLDGYTITFALHYTMGIRLPNHSSIWMLESYPIIKCCKFKWHLNTRQVLIFCCLVFCLLYSRLHCLLCLFLVCH